ncbi:GGDEF domain-containing protein [Celerinatantimonas yamalensis]|uniref:diguanylate cyclase n=1 Tax=Celerinatantimonas yamalensis TaxID=559956 RepID=A0ABW9G4Q2_9GAMM
MQSERQQLFRSLCDEYIEMYASRDNRLFSYFSDNFSGYAGSSDVLITDKNEWIKIIKKDFAQVPDRLHLDMLDLSLQDLDEDVFVVTAFFHIHLPFADDILSKETARLVLIFRRENNLWKIVHSGISIPYDLANSNEVYPLKRLEERNIKLKQLVEDRTHELAEANKQLEILSNTDTLTNLGNRRLFNCMLTNEWNRSHRNKNPLSLILLDIDYFKQFNDHYGHLAGDACLHTLAHCLLQVGRRQGELVARYGGDEFVILLPNTDKTTAFETAQKIQQTIISLAIPHEKSPVGIVTTSIGIASLLQTEDHPPEYLLQQADAALYRSKIAGRNQIAEAN